MRQVFFNNVDNSERIPYIKIVKRKKLDSRFGNEYETAENCVIE